MVTATKNRFNRCLRCQGEWHDSASESLAPCPRCGATTHRFTEIEDKVVCRGAKDCGITYCAHFSIHKENEGCHNGCFGNTGCQESQ